MQEAGFETPSHAQGGYKPPGLAELTQQRKWHPMCETYRLFSSRRAEHAAVRGDGAAVHPLQMARQHLNLLTWQTEDRQ